MSVENPSETAIERDEMGYDVVIVGAGPAGLATAISLKAQAPDLSIAILEKGSEVGAHILSGAVFDPSGLDKLVPDWRDDAACPLKTKVTKDNFYVLGQAGQLPLPNFLLPPLMGNHGNYIGSLGDVCRWLGHRAENMGVEIYPGFAGVDLVYDENGAVDGVLVGDLGVAKDGSHKRDFTPGIILRARYTLLGEGVRGSLSKNVIAKFGLDEGAQPQKYGIGIKELWQIDPANHQPGKVMHSFGWPLKSDTGGGAFLYHWGQDYVSVGYVVHLNYKNPYLSPFEEFQRYKHHDLVASQLKGGKRIAYGARAISEGGIQSMPKLTFPGGALLGCAAGMVNVPRIKGSHNAIKSGILAATAIAQSLNDKNPKDLGLYQTLFDKSDIVKELKLVRNAKPLWSRFGTWVGIGLGGVDMWITTLLGGFSFFGTLGHGKSDAQSLEHAILHQPIDYPKPDNVLSFDRLSSVFLSNTNHEEDQPCHLKVADMALQKSSELMDFAGPSARYCPAGVYEWVDEGADKRFQINAQNCVHCKTCDIKDPNGNINWTPPQGGEGPIYSAM